MKKFVSGLIIGMGLMLAFNVQAEVTSFIGKTIDGQFPVTVEGEVISFPGITIEGKSYLPTRTIAELSGFDVKFDADLGIELVKKETITLQGKVESMNTPLVEEKPVDPDFIQKQIELVDGQIETQRRLLVIPKYNLENAKNEENKSEAIEQIAQIEAEITRLETKKTELQSQLTGAPE